MVIKIINVSLYYYSQSKQILKMANSKQKTPSHLDIEATFELLKKVNGTSYVLISELATELSIKKTALMEIIINNPENYTWQIGLKTGKAILTYIK